MESDQVFEAGANTRERQARDPASLAKGHDGALAAGGISSALLNEETPLLSRDETISLGPSYSDEEEDTTPAEWTSSNVFHTLPWWKRPSIFWLLPSTLVHTLAFGGIIVPKLTLILQLICKDYLADRATHDAGFFLASIMLDGETDAQCRDAKVQELVSKFTVGLQLASAIPSILIAPKLGSLSDQYGRIKVLAFTGIGILISEIATILAAKYPDTFSVNWIVAGAVVDGFCGTFITAMAITSAYASDCYPPSKRGIIFGWIHGCLFTGIALGPFVAAFIIQLTGSVLQVFYIALGVHALFLPYVLFVVPESLTKERQLAARQRTKAVGVVARQASADDRRRWWRRALSFTLNGGGLFRPLSILWPTGPGTSRALRRNLVVLASVDGVVFGVAMGSMTVVVYYLGYMFDWDAADSSLFIATISTCRVLILLLVLPMITRIVQGKTDPSKKLPKSGSTQLDITLIRVSVLFDTIGFIGYAIAGNGGMFLTSGCVAAIGAIASPTLQSSLTKHVPPDRTGQLLGAIGLLHGLGRIVAPVVFNLIYAETVEFFPQTVFVCLASMFGLAFMMSLFIRPHVYLEDENQDEPQSDTVDAERERVRDDDIVR